MSAGHRDVKNKCACFCAPRQAGRQAGNERGVLFLCVSSCNSLCVSLCVCVLLYCEKQDELLTVSHRMKDKEERERERKNSGHKWMREARKASR